MTSALVIQTLSSQQLHEAVGDVGQHGLPEIGKVNVFGIRRLLLVDRVSARAATISTWLATIAASRALVP
jgi:hypothetical protein